MTGASIWNDRLSTNARAGRKDMTLCDTLLGLLLFSLVTVLYELDRHGVGTAVTQADLLVSRLMTIVAIALLLGLIVFSRRRIMASLVTLEQAQEARQQADELFNLTDMLQSADSYEDATAVLQVTTQQILPDLGTALYIFNQAGDQLELSKAWNLPAGCEPSPTLAPDNCWALKRGRSHLNDPLHGSVCCSHHTGSTITLEFPMQARGSVFGLIKFIGEGEEGCVRLGHAERIGRAMAESISLALSNIQLRETLRNQSLRDPLTGLYNRGYLDETFDRLQRLAERNQSHLSLVMIDLDNFKMLNDTYGHAKGDAVLSDVAHVIQGHLRASDLACRYGGEELVLILPDCSLDQALVKAEQCRGRIEALSGAHHAKISASFGVATYPETSKTCEALLGSADAALYQAKALGRNRVEWAACPA
ncbi:GGDEF domain-containing protein [Novosphingobium sp. SG707]|uniref:sensor domain-containing diguanylate cyclase n=1 Tax=Novosphingobium sp. SG707 TaxID=2586996 RepID=UPI001447B438|nr:GGDEF domain-containing protein [Novosphingobium sp. SG707]NKI99772.1 diguanylate cyclase (GGDEF)-like protein [Novosphingobium sp. SG707]